MFRFKILSKSDLRFQKYFWVFSFIPFRFRFKKYFTPKFSIRVQYLKIVGRHFWTSAPMCCWRSWIIFDQCEVDETEEEKCDIKENPVPLSGTGIGTAVMVSSQSKRRPSIKASKAKRKTSLCTYDEDSSLYVHGVVKVGSI